MQRPDEELERYLRTFHPRAVRPLKVRRQTDTPRLWRLAVAAAVVLTLGASLWYAQHKTTKPSKGVANQAVRSIADVPHLSTPVLTKLALDDSEAFDALLARQSRAVLPNMQGEQSALRVLAKE